MLIYYERAPPIDFIYFARDSILGARMLDGDSLRLIAISRLFRGNCRRQRQNNIDLFRFRMMELLFSRGRIFVAISHTPVRAENQQMRDSLQFMK